MAYRSVNNLQLSRDDMRRVYQDHARNCGGPIKIKDIIHILEILGPIIPVFFRSSHVNANNNCSSARYGMGYSGEEEDMSFHSSGRYGMGKSHYDMGSNYNDFGRMSYGNVGMSHHKMAHADDYGERSISEEEFERLLDFAEQQNVKMYR